ncbi:MAG: Rrf2 family transcriptional regulator [Hyphomicrobiaceae bacterium]
MRLNKTTSHAIRILIACARADGDYIKVAELSNALEITSQNVFKIVHILSHAGLIAAARGRHGGVRLARAADTIRIGDIVRAMESTEIELDLDGASPGASRGAVRDVNRVLDAALEAFIAILDDHTLAEMAGLETVRPKPARGTSSQSAGATKAPRGRARS